MGAQVDHKQVLNLWWKATVPNMASWEMEVQQEK